MSQTVDMQLNESLPLPDIELIDGELTKGLILSHLEKRDLRSYPEMGLDKTLIFDPRLPTSGQEAYLGEYYTENLLNPLSISSTVDQLGRASIRVVFKSGVIAVSS